MYLKKPVSDEALHQILLAAMCAPSACHKNPWHFVVVKDERTIAALAASKESAAFILDAPVIIVVTVDETQAARWIEDGSVAASHIYLEATNQGLGTCWVQILCRQTASGDDCEMYVQQILGIPKTVRVLCLMPIGHPAQQLPEHIEAEYVGQKVHFDKW